MRYTERGIRCSAGDEFVVGSTLTGVLAAIWNDNPERGIGERVSGIVRVYDLVLKKRAPARGRAELLRQGRQDQLSEGFQNVVGVLGGLHAAHDLRNVAVRVDDKRRPVDAHVRLALVGLLQPDAVLVGHRVIRVR
jgi:hypothetical protein